MGTVNMCGYFLFSFIYLFYAFSCLIFCAKGFASIYAQCLHRERESNVCLELQKSTYIWITDYWLLVMCRTHWDWERNAWNCALKGDSGNSKLTWLRYYYQLSRIINEIPLFFFFRLFFPRIWKVQKTKKKQRWNRTMAILLDRDWLTGWFQLFWYARLKVKGDLVFLFSSVVNSGMYSIVESKWNVGFDAHTNRHTNINCCVDLLFCHFLLEYQDNPVP